jgi:hypothetical protein
MKGIFIFSCIFVITNIFCQAPTINWAKNIGGSDFEGGIPTLIKSLDNKIIVGFSTLSTDVDIQGSHGNGDIWIARMNELGEIEQSKCFGGSDGESGAGNYIPICRTYDGGYIISCISNSSDGDLQNLNSSNLSIRWLFKIDSLFNIVWEKKINLDSGYKMVIAENTSHEILLAWKDFKVTKLSENGDSLWSRNYGGISSFDTNESLIESVSDIIKTDNGGFCIVGRTNSNNGDVTGNNGDHCWVANVDLNGNILWQKCLKTTGYKSLGYSIKKLNNGGFVVVGYVSNPNIFDYANGFVSKLNDFGTVEWEFEYGGTGYDVFTDIEITEDGGCILSGNTSSNDGDISFLKGLSDTWILKLSSAGNIEWGDTFGDYDDNGSNTFENNVRIIEVGVNDYVFATITDENNGDITNNLGSFDAWLVRLSSSNGVSEIQNLDKSKLYPNPIIDEMNIEFSSNQSHHKVDIYDNQSRIVYSTSTTEQNIKLQLEELRSGSYFIKIDDEIKLFEKL